MKVLHIISGLTNGGAEAVLFRLVADDMENTHHIVSMMDDGYYGESFRNKNIAVTTLKMPAGRLTWRGCRKLFQVVKETKPDTVQTWMYHADFIGGLIARLAGVSNIYWGVHHTTHNPKDRWQKKIIPKICAALSYFIPHKILCCAKSAVLVHQQIGYKKDKLVCVKNGYDLEQFSPSENTRNLLRDKWTQNSGVDTNAIIFGMVGRYNPQKDHENLLQALEQLTTQTDLPWHCIMVGSSVETSNEKLIQSVTSKKITDHVSLLGPTNDVPAFMNAVDVHVLPSAFGEAYPNVIAEAMACGTPCIATNVGDSADMIGNTGWIVAPSQPSALCTAMLETMDELVSRPAQWTHRQRSTRAHAVSEFSLDKMKSKYQTQWGMRAGLGVN